MYCSTTRIPSLSIKVGKPRAIGDIVEGVTILQGYRWRLEKSSYRSDFSEKLAGKTGVKFSKELTYWLKKKRFWCLKICTYFFFFLSRGINIVNWITMTRKIRRTPMHDIQEHWTAVSSLLGFISSVYRNLHHWRSNQRPQIAVPKLHNWPRNYHNKSI